MAVPGRITLAGHQRFLVKISWVLADAVQLDPMQNVDDLKRLGVFWGSWLTWRACATDNVICHSMSQADQLIRRDFHHSCNLYIPNDVYSSLDRPPSVCLYAGDFVHDVIRQEEIVAMHLAASTSDIVLLLGFDLTELVSNPDRLQNHRAHHHRHHVRQAMKTNQQVQWVLVDHAQAIGKDFVELENLTQDTLDNVIATLNVS